MQQFAIQMCDGDYISFCSPSDWDVHDTDFGIIGSDVQSIYEMMGAAESEHYANLDKEIMKLSETIRIENIFVHSGTWWSTQDHCVSVLPEDVYLTLKGAEEDFEYEKWVNSKQYLKSLEEYNFHTLVACEKNDSSSPWVGECTGDKVLQALYPISGANPCVLYETFFKDRFRVDAVIRKGFSNGYAKASSPYGDIYIPNRFNGYIGQPGTPTNMTVALQDIGASDKKGNTFRFTCIYIH